jgi:hypothetical protein
LELGAPPSGQNKHPFPGVNFDRDDQKCSATYCLLIAKIIVPALHQAHLNAILGAASDHDIE